MCGDIPLSYVRMVKNRNVLRYWLGYFVRLKKWLRTRLICRRLAKAGGHSGNSIGIGKNVKLPLSSNLRIGNHVSIQSGDIDVRAPVRIGDYVIIGDGVKIITCSHNIDDPKWQFRSYGLEVCDYVWIATGAIILPSCRRIGRGAVVGAGAVIAKDVPDMAVMVGNPATVLRKRKQVHGELFPEVLLSGDFLMYRSARKMGI